MRLAQLDEITLNRLNVIRSSLSPFSRGGGNKKLLNRISFQAAI